CAATRPPAAPPRHARRTPPPRPPPPPTALPIIRSSSVLPFTPDASCRTRFSIHGPILQQAAAPSPTRKGQLPSIVTPDLIRGPAFPRLLSGIPDQVRGDDAGEASITHAPRVTNPEKSPMGAPDHDNQDPPCPAEGRHGVARLPEGAG